VAIFKPATGIIALDPVSFAYKYSIDFIWLLPVAAYHQ
jgi:hypothetical protein